jgi:hypothetical protein
MNSRCRRALLFTGSGQLLRMQVDIAQMGSAVTRKPAPPPTLSQPERVYRSSETLSDNSNRLKRFELCLAADPASTVPLT